MNAFRTIFVTAAAELLAFGACPACAADAADAKPRQAWIVDLGGIQDTKEIYLATALQGIVNRDRPRLFYLTHCEWSAADRLHAEYLSAKKGFTFAPLDGLGAAVQHFARMGLIKGLVEYDIPEGGWNWAKYGFYGHIAITMAGLRDLLPVTPEVLKDETPLLAGRLAWVQDDMDKGGWGEMFAVADRSEKGLTIHPRDKMGERAAAYGCYQSRWVDLDVNATPTLEVTVDETTGPWGVVIKMGSRREANMEGLRIAGPLDKAGVYRFDLRKDGRFDPTAGHAELRLCALDQNTRVTVRRIRFLDAQANVSQRVPDKLDGFKGIPVVEDLRGRFGTNETAACEWALKELLPQCSKDVTFHAQSWWGNLRTLDYAVTRKAFIFYQNRKLYHEPYPFFDEVMRHLSPMAEVLGWGGDESFWIHKVSFLGKREITAGAANLSFWRGVPLGGPLSHPRAEHVCGPVRSKYYVNFLMSSGDAISIVAGYQHGAWRDPARGRVPITWGTNPNLVNMAPALLEMFASEATLADSFCAGPSGSGYACPSVYVSGGSLPAFAEKTRSDMQKAGLSMAVDFWDYAPGLIHRVVPPFTAPGPSLPVRLLLPWPGSGAAENRWLDDGTPAIFGDNTKGDQTWCLWLGMGCSLNREDPVSDLVGRIQRVAAKNDPPFFISVNIRVPVSVLAAVRDRLPADRFEVVGMPDFERLSREAGGFTVAPDGTQAAGGLPFGVTCEVRNADGRQGGAGRVTWALPEGWKADASAWPYGPTPKAGVARRRIVFTPPPCASPADASLVFTDSRMACPRTVRVTCCPGGRMVSDGQTPADWVSTNGVAASMEGGLLRLSPPQPITSEKMWSEINTGPKISVPHGQALLALGAVDLDRQPVLEWEVAARFTGKYAARLLSGSDVRWLHPDKGGIGFVQIDLQLATKWKGVKEIALAIDPVETWGDALYVRRVTLCYRKEAAKQP